MVYNVSNYIITNTIDRWAKMFGMNDQNQQSNDDPAMLDNVKQLASQPASQVSPAQPTSSPASPTTSSFATPVQGFSSSSAPAFTAQTNNAPADNGAAGAGILPEQDSTDDSAPDDGITDNDFYQTPVISGSSGPVNMAPSTSTNSDTLEPENTASSQIEPANTDHLAGLKQEALGHLEKLTDHIDGTPEETFKTTMMMIQANDNHTLLEKALEAAKKIEDDKIRAKALLDIINEINYFASLKEV